MVKHSLFNMILECFGSIRTTLSCSRRLINSVCGHKFIERLSLIVMRAFPRAATEVAVCEDGASANFVHLGINVEWRPKYWFNCIVDDSIFNLETIICRWLFRNNNWGSKPFYVFIALHEPDRDQVIHISGHELTFLWRHFRCPARIVTKFFPNFIFSGVTSVVSRPFRRNRIKPL